MAEFVRDERAPHSNLSKGLERFLAAPHRSPCLLGKGPDRIPAARIHPECFFGPMSQHADYTNTGVTELLGRVFELQESDRASAF